MQGIFSRGFKDKTLAWSDLVVVGLNQLPPPAPFIVLILIFLKHHQHRQNQKPTNKVPFGHVFFFEGVSGA